MQFYQRVTGFQYLSSHSSFPRGVAVSSLRRKPTYAFWTVAPWAIVDLYDHHFFLARLLGRKHLDFGMLRFTVIATYRIIDHLPGLLHQLSFLNPWIEIKRLMVHVVIITTIWSQLLVVNILKWIGRPRLILISRSQLERFVLVLDERLANFERAVTAKLKRLHSTTLSHYYLST